MIFGISKIIYYSLLRICILFSVHQCPRHFPMEGISSKFSIPTCSICISWQNWNATNCFSMSNTIQRYLLRLRIHLVHAHGSDIPLEWSSVFYTYYLSRIIVHLHIITVIIHCPVISEQIFIGDFCRFKLDACYHLSNLIATVRMINSVWLRAAVPFHRVTWIYCPNYSARW